MVFPARLTRTSTWVFVDMSRRVNLASLYADARKLISERFCHCPNVTRPDLVRTVPKSFSRTHSRGKYWAPQSRLSFITLLLYVPVRKFLASSPLIVAPDVPGFSVAEQ